MRSFTSGILNNMNKSPKALKKCISELTVRQSKAFESAEIRAVGFRALLSDNKSR